MLKSLGRCRGWTCKAIILYVKVGQQPPASLNAQAYNVIRLPPTCQQHNHMAEKALLSPACMLQGLDVYSNILYVKEGQAQLSHLAHRMLAAHKFRPETCCIVGNYFSLKGDHEQARAPGLWVRVSAFRPKALSPRPEEWTMRSACWAYCLTSVYIPRSSCAGLISVLY